MIITAVTVCGEQRMKRQRRQCKPHQRLREEGGITEPASRDGGPGNPRESVPPRDLARGTPVWAALARDSSRGSLARMNSPQGPPPQVLAWIQAAQLLRGAGARPGDSVGPWRGLAPVVKIIMWPLVVFQEVGGSTPSVTVLCPRLQCSWWPAAGLPSSPWLTLAATLRVALPLGGCEVVPPRHSLGLSCPFSLTSATHPKPPGGSRAPPPCLRARRSG